MSNVGGIQFAYSVPDSPLVLEISGNAGNSDIRYNDFKGKLVFRNTKLGKSQISDAVAGVVVEPFTGNCGVKAISSLWASGSMSEFIEVLESFLYHMTNAGFVVGSDWVSGRTIQIIKMVGKDYIFSKEIWNPNYTWDADARKHNIVLFHKQLKDDGKLETWRPLLPPNSR